MGKLIAIHSFRGGTGKSNITGNIGALLALDGYRVGIVDTDIQSPGIHALFNFSADQIRFSLNEYLLGQCAIGDAAYEVTDRLPLQDISHHGHLFLIPASMKTGEITRILQEGYDVGRLNIGFQELIQKMKLDFLIIDTHPGISEETLLSAAVSDALILILRPDRQDYQGTAIMMELAKQLRIPNIKLIINKALNHKDFTTLKQRVESTYGAPVLGIIPLSDDVAALGSGGLFCLSHQQHEMTRVLKNIVAEFKAL